MPRWILTGRAGAGASVSHPESTIGGVSLEGCEWGSFSLQGTAGVEVRIVKRIFLAGEYKLTHTAQHVSVAGGSARTPLTTHHVVTGMVVHVGR
jgi:opacity protein-like surface antigen